MEDNFLKKKEVQKALKEAKKLEKHIIPQEEIVKTYEEGLEQLNKLKEFLKPAWFVKDTDSKKKKR